LDILLDSFELLGRTDVELDVYSSAKIYGDHFVKITQGRFDELFERTRTTPGVTFHEYQPNEVVRSALQRAHIFAYPSIFEETSCLAAIEAAAQAVLDARASFPQASLADLYDPLAMPPALTKAHQQLDKTVDAAYAYKGQADDASRVAFLFGLYEFITSAVIPSNKSRLASRLQP
jgi:hypothetical protein